MDHANYREEDNLSDTAITTIVTGLVTIVTMLCGVLTLWLKARDNSRKIDDNTAATIAGTAAAANNAKLAATTAAEAKTTARETKEAVVSKLNGGIDSAIAASLAPMMIRLDKLEEYNRTSSHRLFDAINAIHLRLVAATALKSDLPSDREP